VGPKVGMGVFAVFLACYLVVVGPWIRVLAPDWSEVCFFGSMRCHRHVGACVAARRHVACYGSYRVHMISSAYLSHPALMYANDISVSIISTSPLQWCRPFWHLRFL
jgi:hypothetical protein